MLEANLIVGLFRTTLGLNAPLYITGIDLSPQMVNIANQVSLPDYSGESEVRAVVGDAAELSQSHRGSADLIFSSFGLQQLGSRAPHVLSDWCLCLNEGGLLLIVLWPSRAEEEGPWKAYQDAVNDLNGLPSSHQSQEEEWEHNLLSEALKLDRIKVLSDEILQHEISWSGVDECWRVMTRGGPWTARRVKYGNEHMDDLKLRWEKCLKNGLVLQSSIKHYPRARIIAIRKEYNGAFPVRQKL